MASNNQAERDETDEHLNAVEEVLEGITDNAGRLETSLEYFQTSSDTPRARSWFRAVLPYESVEDFESRWHLGNYVIDRQTGKKSFEPMSIYVRLGMHLLYYGSPQATMLHWKRTQTLLKEQSVALGKQYDSPQSRAHIKPFIESFRLQGTLSDLVEPDPSKYKTFNEFFAREMKESARPMTEPANDKVMSSVADCRLTTYTTIDLATKYWIKGFGFTVSKLLRSDALGEIFKGGSILIHRLAPQDYHRWHAPTSGTIVSITEIPGTYYTVNPQAINEAGTLDVFSENRRSVMLLKRPSGSLVAIVAVGAMLVGSIRYNPGINEGLEVRRGQCLGAFLYGGSTVITLYPKDGIRLDEDLVRNSTEQKCETYVKVGWRVGVEP